MDYGTLYTRKDKHVFTVTLNRPDRLNSMNERMFKEICLALEEAEEDDEVRVVIITGAGRAFCSGADLGTGPEGEKIIDEQRAEVVRLDMRRIQAVARMIRKTNKVVVAMVNGVAVGGGFDLASACDLRTGSKKASFTLGFARIGLVPGMGGTWLLPQILGVSKAAELVFTNSTLEAGDAERFGYLNKLVQAEDLEKETMDLAEQIAKLPPIALRLAKLQLYGGLRLDLDTALDMIAVSQGIAASTDDHKEAVAAFREKRTGEYRAS
jgi:enoyl-CoA hydratase/carnithine racemase